MGQGDYKKYVDIYLIRIGDHEMVMRKVNKLALNSFDVKRKYINCYESVPWTKQIFICFFKGNLYLTIKKNSKITS